MDNILFNDFLIMASFCGCIRCSGTNGSLAAYQLVDVPEATGKVLTVED